MPLKQTINALDPKLFHFHFLIVLKNSSITFHPQSPNTQEQAAPLGFRFLSFSKSLETTTQQFNVLPFTAYGFFLLVGCGCFIHVFSLFCLNKICSCIKTNHYNVKLSRYGVRKINKEIPFSTRAVRKKRS